MKLTGTDSALLKSGEILNVIPSWYHGDSKIAAMERWENIVSVVENAHIGLTSDGRVVVAALRGGPNGNVSSWTDVVAVYGITPDQGGHTIGIQKNGTILAVGDTKGIAEVAAWTDIRMPEQ